MAQDATSALAQANKGEETPPKLTLRLPILHPGHRQVQPNLRLGDLGVIDTNLSTLVQEVLANGGGGALPRVSGILLECETEDGNLLARDGVEEGGDDPLGETTLLVLVHRGDLLGSERGQRLS